MDQMRRASLFFMLLQTVALDDFRMYVTDLYIDTMVCLDDRGNEIYEIDIPSAGISTTIDMFGKKAVNHSIVYSDAGAMYRMNMDGSDRHKLLYTAGPVSLNVMSVAVDPTTRNIYYTARSYAYGTRGQIAMLSPYGEHILLVTDDYVDSPNGLALHPAKGLLFWTDNPYIGDSAHVIGTADMAGNGTRAFISNYGRFPRSLAIDFKEDMLYWTDMGTIYRCDLNGHSTEEVLSGLPGSYGVILIDGPYLFFTDVWHSAIERVRLHDVSDRMTFRNINGTKPRSMAVISTDVLHTPRSTQCSARNGLGDCSNVCIPVADKYFCACDNATTLQENGRTCENAILCPENIPNGKISSSCYRHKFEQCEFDCDPGRYSDVDKITCIIGEWNDSNPCNKECEQGTWGDKCGETCSCDFEKTWECSSTTGYCDCKNGWAGVHCTSDINECNNGSNICPHNSACVNVEGSFLCICQTGYFKTTSGMCEVVQRCSDNCVNGTCYQNKTCMEGCELNHWGPECNQECGDGCAQGPDNSTSVCDRNGICVYGCKKTFTGPNCLDFCPDNDCNETLFKLRLQIHPEKTLQIASALHLVFCC